MAAIGSYLAAHHLPQEHALLGLDGQYGTGAVLADLADFSFVMRGKDDGLLDRPEVQSRLHLPPISSPLAQKVISCARSTIVLMCLWGLRAHVAGWWWRRTQRTLRRAGSASPVLASSTNSFSRACERRAFTEALVVALYLHRGAFEPALADEDQEQDPDRWCSHSPWGQECWQIVSQWVWNLRLELGHHLEPTPLRITKFAVALPPVPARAAPSSGYAPAEVALPWKAGRFVFARLCASS